jgi:hypothetical protein
LPELQQHAAARESDPGEDVEARRSAPPVAPSANADVSIGPPRVRRPRWTPAVHYVETTDVEIVIDDDAPAG